MMSSLARKLGFFSETRNLDIEEGLPLLEDNDKFHDLLDVEENEFVKIEHKAIPKTFLINDINACLVILNTAQQASSDYSIRRLKWHVFQTAVALFSLTATISSPVMIYKVMTYYANVFRKNYLMDIFHKREEINLLIKENKDQINNLKNFMEELANKDEEIIDEWVREDCNYWDAENSKEWLAIKLFKDTPCIFKDFDVSHPDDSCNAFAEQYCNNSRQEHDIWNKRQHLVKQNLFLEKKIDYLDWDERVAKEAWNIRFLVHAEQYFYPLTFLGVSLVAIIIAIYYPFSWHDSHEEYKYDLKQMKKVISLIKDPQDAIRLINLSSRLGIKLNEVTIEKLIERLEAEVMEINNRWKCRTAFLGGGVDKNASNHLFLNADGARDVTKIIFEKADLQPVRNDVNSARI